MESLYKRQPRKAQGENNSRQKLHLREKAILLKFNHILKRHRKRQYTFKGRKESKINNENTFKIITSDLQWWPEFLFRIMINFLLVLL